MGFTVGGVKTRVCDYGFEIVLIMKKGYEIRGINLYVLKIRVSIWELRFYNHKYTVSMGLRFVELGLLFEDRASSFGI